MKERLLLLVTVIVLVGVGIAALVAASALKARHTFAPVDEAGLVRLPEPAGSGQVSVEEALLRRRSIREYKDEPLSLSEVSQLLWAAQGVTDPATGFRTAPSAGALYPLEVYVVAGHVSDLPAGVYRYDPHGHTLARVAAGDKRDDLYSAAVHQAAVRDAPAVIVFAAAYERTTVKYGERGLRYVQIEVGHAAQNVYLQAVALGLGTVVIGAFYDDQVKQALGLPAQEEPLCVMPVGKKQP